MSLERLLAEEAELEKQMFGNESSEEIITPPEASLEDPEDSYVDESAELDGFPKSTTVLTQEIQGPENEEDAKKKVSWKERHKRYKASTDKTIFTLRKENSSLRETVGAQNVEIDKLKADLSALKGSRVDIFQGIITPEDSETIGEEAVDIMKRTSQKAIEASLEPLKDKIRLMEAEKAEERKKQALLKEQASYNIFLTELEGFVNDYRVIDKDPKFSEYLEGYDEVTGEKRFDVFKRAEDYRDAERVADFFLDFKRTSPRSKREILAENITPSSTTSTGNIPKPKAAETFTPAQVEKFFDDVTKGVYKHRRKEADEIEARITKAYMEGRIH